VEEVNIQQEIAARQMEFKQKRDFRVLSMVGTAKELMLRLVWAIEGCDSTLRGDGEVGFAPFSSVQNGSVQFRAASPWPEPL
jgi:hypothetical protein